MSADQLELPPFLVELLAANIDVTIQKSSEHGYVFDLNLEAKSHLHLYKAPSGWMADMRYGVKYPVHDIEDLKECARKGMHGRDYINQRWAEFLVADQLKGPSHEHL